MNEAIERAVGISAVEYRVADTASSAAHDYVLAESHAAEGGHALALQMAVSAGRHLAALNSFLFGAALAANPDLKGAEIRPLEHAVAEYAQERFNAAMQLIRNRGEAQP